MWEVYTRRQYLAAAGATIALAGYDDNDDQPPADTPEATPTETLVVPTETTTTVSPTPGSTPTVIRSSMPTTTATATPTATPAQELVIPAGEEHMESSVPAYTGIEWYNTGLLVLENDAGLRLTDMGGDK